MRKILLSLTIVFLAFPYIVHAQVFDFQKAYQDFIFNFDQYKAADSAYQLARVQYLQSNTLASKAKAQEATYKMIQARDEVIKTHLTALRQRIAESVGTSQDRKEVLYGKIDLEVSWYDKHKNGISSAASIEDLVRDSNTARERYRSTTNPIIFEIVTEVSIGKEYFLRQKQLSLMADLNSKLAEIRANGDIQTDRIERDLLEVENRQERSVAKEEDAKRLQIDLLTSGDGAEQIYNQIIFRVGESMQYLKEANTFLKEIVQEVKSN